MTTTIRIPVPPASNKLWVPVRTGRGARLVKRKPYTAWLESVRPMIAVAWPHPPVEPWVVTEVTIVAGIAWRRDLDSVLKATLDALEGSVLSDDRYVGGLIVKRSGRPEDAGVVEVTVRIMDDEEVLPLLPKRLPATAKRWREPRKAARRRTA